MNIEEKKATPEEARQKVAKAKFDAAFNQEIDFKGLKKSQRRQLFALKLMKGNISKAAMMLGVTRHCFYEQCKDNAEYKAYFEDIRETVHDYVDDALIKKIEEGDTTAIIWYDKTRGRHMNLANNLKIDHTTKGESMNKGFADFLKEVAVVPNEDGEI